MGLNCRRGELSVERRMSEKRKTAPLNYFFRNFEDFFAFFPRLPLNLVNFRSRSAPLPPPPLKCIAASVVIKNGIGRILY